MSDLSQLFKYLQTPKIPQQAQRLFHGRGKAYKGFHHITVDWLPPVALITLFDTEPLAEIEKAADYLLSLLPSCSSVQVQHRYLQSGPIDLVHGNAIQNLIIYEDDLQFKICLGKARNTGLFLDMSNGRRWIKQNCKDKKVLNLFSYTCGFSVAAIAGQAKSVLNIDMSSPALNVGRENHRLNQQSLEQVQFEKLDIFKSFSRLKKRGPFELLICDPPTRQKGSVDIAKDYPKILRRLEQFMAPKSTLFLCLNAPELSRDYLIDHMATLAPSYKLIEEVKPPEVYVESEKKGLKVFCFEC